MKTHILYFIRKWSKAIDLTVLYVSLLSSIGLLFLLGYNTNLKTLSLFHSVLPYVFYTLYIINASRTFMYIWVSRKIKAEYIGGLILTLYLFLIAATHMAHTPMLAFFQQIEWLYFGIFTITLMEISRSSLFFDNFYFNPTILFVISFLALIAIGAFLLMLPKSVYGTPLTFVDALFMATSAVSITGLAVVDVASRFTLFGQSILLILIQLGGLGIMTFTGFFGYFFSGGFSYKNQLMYGEIIGHNKVGSVIRTLLKIISFTILMEALGAILVFISTSSQHFSSLGEHLFFSVFHAISAFCNAGFTIVEGGFQQEAIKFNYPLQLIIAVLFILGGIGFAIVFNLATYIKYGAVNIFKKLFFGQSFRHKAWIISFNSRLMARASLILIVTSTLFTLLLEYNHALAEHQGLANKLTAALFIGNSSRSSGFSITDTAQLSLPMVLISMAFMWVGASPGSTGGGIKTTTISVALLNIISLAKGRDQLEIFHRKVSTDSVQKAFAIIVLSLVGMGISTLLLSITDGQHSMKSILYEVFSAYSTCGLSLGITPQLSDAGKIIISITMFVGRVGFLTLLVAIIKNIKNKSYTYPEEKVLF